MCPLIAFSIDVSEGTSKLRPSTHDPSHCDIIRYLVLVPTMAI